MNAINFKEHLRKQLNFLERSCASYDNGYEDEAVRIATVIRVLIHNTNSSTSLLQHLNATSIKLLSTTEPHTDNPGWTTVMSVGLGVQHMSCEKMEYLPEVGNGPPLRVKDLVPVSEWWNQIVMVVDERKISRKNIVLGAANKDGGAHVDAELSTEYAALASDGAIGSFFYESKESRVVTPIKNAHLVSLRQLGYELLQSSELIALGNE